jgi:hypothetical protein
LDGPKKALRLQPLEVVLLLDKLRLGIDAICCSDRGGGGRAFKICHVVAAAPISNDVIRCLNRGSNRRLIMQRDRCHVIIIVVVCAW